MSYLSLVLIPSGAFVASVKDADRNGWPKDSFPSKRRKEKLLIDCTDRRRSDWEKSFSESD